MTERTYGFDVLLLHESMMRANPQSRSVASSGKVDAAEAASSVSGGVDSGAVGFSGIDSGGRAPEWIELAGGGFPMGGGPAANENPRRWVVVHPFRLARTPVTRGAYDRFLADTGSPAPRCFTDPRFADPRMPAVGVSWWQARAFCDWLAARTGEPVRLPTEAEWEFAARGGRDVAYPWGDRADLLPEASTRWRDGPEPVDRYPSPHPWGFLGLGENVHEWCADWYAGDYYRHAPTVDPRGPASGTRRASRGGSWRHAVKVTRCAARSSIPPDREYTDYGFRLAAGPRPW